MGMIPLVGKKNSWERLGSNKNTVPKVEIFLLFSFSSLCIVYHFLSLLHCTAQEEQCFWGIHEYRRFVIHYYASKQVSLCYQPANLYQRREKWFPRRLRKPIVGQNLKETLFSYSWIGSRPSYFHMLYWHGNWMYILNVENDFELSALLHRSMTIHA